MITRVEVSKVLKHKDIHFIFNFILNVENYSQIMPNVHKIEILQQQDAEKRITKWDTDIDGAPLVWIENEIIDRKNLKMHFDSIDGDFEIFRGYWAVEQEGQDIKVTCHIEYEIGIPIIEEIVGGVVKERMEANLEIMLTAIQNTFTPKRGNTERIE
jgi:ribosome-associated toxin RatA of RatAB toxin-antitoxin module